MEHRTEHEHDVEHAIATIAPCDILHARRLRVAVDDALETAERDSRRYRTATALRKAMDTIRNANMARRASVLVGTIPDDEWKEQQARRVESMLRLVSKFVGPESDDMIRTARALATVLRLDCESTRPQSIDCADSFVSMLDFVRSMEVPAEATWNASESRLMRACELYRMVPEHVRAAEEALADGTVDTERADRLGPFGRLDVVERAVRTVLASGSVPSRDAVLALVERLRVAGRVQCLATWGAYVVLFDDAEYTIGAADSTGRATVR